MKTVDYPCEHGYYGLCTQCVREERNELRARVAELEARIAELQPMAQCAAIMAVCGYFSRLRRPDAWLDHGSWDEYPELFACAGVDLRSFQHGTRFYAGSAPVPAAQDFSLMQGGYCCECGHELCDTCAPLHPIMPWPAAQAESKVADDVDLWKFCRDALKRGAEIESQFSQQGYETFIAEIECAAKKEEKRLRAMLAAKAKEGS